MAALAVSILCLALNAFFVAAEFALVKVQVTRITPRARRGDRRAREAERVLRRLDRYLSVTQFGITVASLGLGWVGEPAIERLGDYVAVAVTGAALGPTGHVVASLMGLGVLTFLHLLLGELVPKFIAIQRAEKTVLLTAIPLRLVYLTFRPVLYVLEKSQSAVLHLLGMSSDVASEGRLSEEEIIGMLAASVGHTEEGREKRHLMERVLRFARRPVRLVAIPRVDVVTLPVMSSGERAYEVFVQSELSRIPLTAGDSRDEVVGYVYAKDFLRDPAARSSPDLLPYRRDVLFVPDSRDGIAVLRDMQRRHVPLAVVVDEYGGMRGIVTLEDLVEEVFGEIHDELDVEPPKIEVAEEGRAWDVDASVTTDVLGELGLVLDEEIEADEQLTNVVTRRLGRLPRVGDVVAIGPRATAQVVAMARRRVRRVRVRGETPRT